MGSGPSQNLDEYGDACEMYKIVTKTLGLPVSSASKTDVWLVEFEEGVNYDGEPVKNAFIKWFVDADGVESQSLLYEIEIYRDLIRPIIDKNICPNFIKYYGNGIKCTGDQMVKFLDGGRMVYSTGESVMTAEAGMPDRPSVAEFFKRTAMILDPKLPFGILFQMSQKAMFNRHHETGPTRPVIASREYIKQLASHAMFDEYYNSKNNTYNLLVTEQITSSTTDLFKYLKTTPIEKSWGVIFQVMCACYAMSLAKINHNDIHGGNVWVDSLSAPRTWTYIIEGEYYRVTETRHLAKVFDFDRSYAESLGRNELLDSGDYGPPQKNVFEANKDMVRILCEMNKAYHDESILDIVSGDEVVKKQFKKYYTLKQNGHDTCWFMGNTGDGQYTSMGPDMWAKARPALDILKMIGSKAGYSISKPKNSSKSKLLYVMNSDMFEADGKVK